MVFPQGLGVERGTDERLRLRDSTGPGAWGPPGQPLFLDRHVPGERYLLLPDGHPALDTLFVIADILPAQAADAGHESFAEGWSYEMVKTFDRDVTWESVRREGHLCHRLVQGGRPGEWAYAHEAAFLPGDADVPAACVLAPGHNGQAPAEQLLEIAERLTGTPPPPPKGLHGLLYLRSDPKDGAKFPTALAMVKMQGGKIAEMKMLEGGNAAFARFPDPGSGEREVMEWACFLGNRPDWPCVNRIFNPTLRGWAQPGSPEELLQCLTGMEVPAFMLLDQGPDEPVWQ